MKAPGMFAWGMAYVALHVGMRMAMDGGAEGAEQFWSFRAVISDVAASAILAFIAVGLARLWRWLPYLLLAAWCVALAGNREYVADWQANMSVLDISELGNSTFLLGSVLISPLFVAAGVCLAGGLLILGLSGLLRGRFSRRMPRGTRPGLFLLACLLFIVWPMNPLRISTLPSLLESNLFQLAYLARDQFSGTETVASFRAAQRMLKTFEQQSLAGKRQVAARPKSNVLILMVEALSEQVLQAGWMPHLQARAARGMHYTQIVNPSVGTTRGKYALLCGKSPYLGMPLGQRRLSQIIKKEKTACLPKQLARHGYRTLSLQPAGLDFQGAGLTLSATGFKQVKGGKIPGRRYTQWGVGDVDLYKEVAKSIDRFESESDSPWMVMSMTVSTHHPYVVDKDFMPEMPRRERSFRYADQALEGLLLWMESTGRLEDTLVVITGDESREARRGKPPYSALPRSHGFLVMLTPNQDRGLYPQRYMQSDIAISVLDYLGITPHKSLKGHSLFRPHAASRPVYFGDPVRSTLSIIEKDGKKLVYCYVRHMNCYRYTLGNESLFEMQFARPEEISNQSLRAFWQLHKARWSGFSKTYTDKPLRYKRRIIKRIKIRNRI